MKLKIFRIICSVILAILALLGVAIAVYNIIVANDRQAESYLLYLICFFIGFLFLTFETYFVIKSFKSGTLLLHDICLKNKSNIKRPITLIASSIISALALAFLILNICIYAGLTSIQQGPMAVEFNMYFSVLVLVNTLILIIYYLFIVQDDIEIQN